MTAKLMLAMLCMAMMAAASPLALNADFTALNPAGNAPRGWEEELAHQGGFGECRLLPDAQATIQIITYTKLTNYYCLAMFAVTPGDVVTLTAQVHGEGSFGLTLYLYDSGYITALPRVLKTVREAPFQTQTHTFQIPRTCQNRTPKIARAVFFVGPDSLVSIRNLKGTRTQQGPQP